LKPVPVIDVGAASEKSAYTGMAENKRAASIRWVIKTLFRMRDRETMLQRTFTRLYLAILPNKAGLNKSDRLFYFPVLEDSGVKTAPNGW